MNKQEKYDDDLLRRFLNPGKIEKAPEGFSSKTLARIQIEAQSLKVTKGFLSRNRVPLISAAFTALLIAAAAIIPANEAESVGSTLWKYLVDLEFTLPVISSTFFEKVNFPGWIKYAALIFFLLAFLDRALFKIFHKG
jgi:hypothetical protein